MTTYETGRLEQGSVLDPERLAKAKALHVAGDLDATRACYEAMLVDDPAHADVRFRLGILELQCGRPVQALACVERALEHAPHESRYRLGRARILATLQRFDETVDACRALLADDTAVTDARLLLADALHARGDWRDAAAAYEAILALEPVHVDALNNLGNTYRLLGDATLAEAAYRRALACDRHAGALTNLGTLLRAAGRNDEGIAMLREAVDTDPHSAAAHANLGVALLERGDAGDPADAFVLIERAAALDPSAADIAYNLGNAAHALGRHDDALAHYRRAIAQQPDHADAHNNLGNVLKQRGAFDAAADAFEHALRVQPTHVAAHNNLGNLHRTLGRIEEAETCIRRALAVAPAHSVSHNNLGNVLKDGGALNDAIASYRRAVDCDADNVVAHSNLLYALTFESEDARAVLDEAHRWSARHEAPLRATRLAHEDSPCTHASARRLRIGYVSADFRDHCQALFLMPLLAHHDRSAFEIVCYANVERPDAMTRRLAHHVDVWRDIRALDDERLAHTIHADGIDILVDLTMHMADGRPLAFARRPAPVQVAWLAYPGTTGLDAIDYRLTDPHLDPPEHDGHYRERSMRLADTFWCYDPLVADPLARPEPGPLPAFANGYITFGCLNNPCKLTDRTLRMWAGAMHALPDARLVLMAAPGIARERLAARAAGQGIDAARLAFVPFRPRADYLASYRDIDIGLDTFPYNGHTTSLDALWMGVPVVTRVGETAVGRGGLSQLTNLGLAEFAAPTDEAFVRTVLALAGGLPALAALRNGLRARMERSPLMDGARFARQIEAAYRQMWATHTER
ncbi:tetratricopeptide repeat protein [Paraburkholderia sp.]|uniref:tetratricopeptide repeat protein n=1 Tax=Paraburkholderia sp. TaxID=1926495 RepID=UPI003D6F8616